MIKKATILFTLGALILFGFNSFKTDDSAAILDVNEYKVITVQGKILFEKSGEEMKRGDSYIKGTALDFLTNRSRAAIINHELGRFVLSGNTKGKLQILPAANNISSRGGAILNIVDLKKHFSDRYLVLKKSEVQIGNQSFPMDENNFFYLKFKHDGEKIAKRLSHEGDFLILDKEEIFKIDGKPIPVDEKEMTLYYMKNGKGTKISTFTPIFPDNQELIEEVSVILEMVEDETDEKKISEVTAFLIEFYGNPHNDNLKSWLKSEFELEIEK